MVLLHPQRGEHLLHEVLAGPAARFAWRHALSAIIPDEESACAGTRTLHSCRRRSGCGGLEPEKRKTVGNELVSNGLAWC